MGSDVRIKIWKRCLHVTPFVLASGSATKTVLGNENNNAKYTTNKKDFSHHSVLHYTVCIIKRYLGFNTVCFQSLYTRPKITDRKNAAIN